MISRMTSDAEYWGMYDVMKQRETDGLPRLCSRCGNGEYWNIKIRKKISWKISSPNYPLLCERCYLFEYRNNITEEQKEKYNQRRIEIIKNNPNYHKELYQKCKQKNPHLNILTDPEQIKRKNQRQREYYKIHRTQHLAYTKKYHHEHKEELKKKAKQRYIDNKKRINKVTLIGRRHLLSRDPEAKKRYQGYSHNWYIRNKEKAKTRYKKRYNDKREEIRKKNKAYNSKHREEIREYHRQHYHEHREEILRKQKEHTSKPEVKRRKAKYNAERISIPEIRERAKECTRNWHLRQKIFNTMKRRGL